MSLDAGRHRLRATARWLLVACIALGPAGAGAAPSHGVSPEGCPCDCADAADRAATTDGARTGDRVAGAAEPTAAGAGHVKDEADPCDGGCGEGCLECGCCPAPALAALTLATSTATASRAATRAPGRQAAGSPGARCAVFRPPRT